MLKFFAGVTLAVALLSIGIGVGYASRNASGTMSAINGPYTPGSVISSSIINARFADIENELTDSKSRSGKGDFTAPVRGANGTVAAPTWSFTSEPGSGLYRIGAGDIGFTLLGTKTGEWTANGYRSADGAVATPSLSFFNDTGSGLYRIGANNIGFAINGSKRSEWTATGVVVTGTLNATGAVTATGLLTATAGIDILSGVGADKSGFKHIRGVAGCTTAAVAGATCNSTVTWGTTFADANYTAICNVDGSSGPVAYVGIFNKLAGSLQVGITAVTAVAATATNFECIAVHD